MAVERDKHYKEKSEKPLTDDPKEAERDPEFEEFKRFVKNVGLTQRGSRLI